MKNIILLLTFFSILGSSSAQNFVGKFNPQPHEQPKLFNSSDTLKIFAVIIEFQEDQDPNTYGTGKLGTIFSKDYGNTIIDPLPHDAQYFSDHLEFAKNYYHKVSNGKVNIEYTVYPQVITVSQAMRGYAPPETSVTFDELGDLCEEIWQASQNFSGVNLADYDLFTIFHAGVGRGLREGISLGNNRDLPSIYFSLKAFQKIYGEQFSGFDTGNNFKIQNTMIIPETDSRETDSFGSVYLTELSINGLIAGSIGSYLGLPDLFDTETGLSAIGRFGLMDGQALYAYRGLFPPEPSAWEKIYMGWETPTELSVGNHKVNVTANLAASAGDTTILKIPINSQEYYLVEKRARDAKKDGCKITYRLNGQTLTKTYTKDQEGFIYYDISDIDGVVIDVDEFDWAVPGIDSNFEFENPFEDAGLVIWHIDENVINANIAANKINVDKTNRGVDVEEADGVQDIGEQFNTIFGTTEIGEGTKEDTWYSGNPADLYKNIFNSESYPNTKSNSGANSLITMKNFSGIDNRMSFEVSYGEGEIKLISRSKLPLNNSVEYLSTTPSNDVILCSNDDLTVTDVNGNVKKTVPNFSKFRPAVGHVYPTSKDYVLGVFDNNINIFYTNTTELTSIAIDHNISCPPIVGDMAFVGSYVYVGTENGKILEFNITETISELSTKDCFDNKPVRQICGNGEYLSVISENEFWDSNNKSLSFNATALQLSVFQYSFNYGAVILTEGNNFYFIYDGEIKSDINYKSQNNIEKFILTDLKSDGGNYITFTDENEIIALNLSGNQADNFPFIDNQENSFENCVLSFDYDKDGYFDLLVSNNVGEIFMISGNSGKAFENYPISFGSGISSFPLLFNANNEEVDLAVTTITNEMFVWKIKSSTDLFGWIAEFANRYNDGIARVPMYNNQITEFFPENRVYNWPNPVYDGETNIRYFVSEDSQIKIKIFDLAGDLVAEMNDNATGGFDNETKWNVADIQSGVYFAHVEAVGSSGKSQSKIIKIAVIK
ncbi:MAG: T9SS type A sorting domain-containing protein [bacterium]